MLTCDNHNLISTCHPFGVQLSLIVTDFGFSWWFTADVDSILRSLHCVDVGSIADV
jgi:hypothetical protein